MTLGTDRIAHLYQEEKMPFVTLGTNLPAAAIPSGCLTRLITQVLAPTMSKPLEKFRWTLETDKVMSKGPDRADKPYMLLRIEAVKTFESPDNVKLLTPKIYQFLQGEIDIKQEDIGLICYTLPATHIGVNGVTLDTLS